MRSVKRGDRYIHPRLLESDYRTRATVEVTAVRGGWIYYQQVDRATGDADGMKCKTENVIGWQRVEDVPHA
jgi:hypothetical protein